MEVFILKNKDILADEKGVAMIIVVVIMSVVLMMASILLTYSIRNYKYQFEYIHILQREELADSGINEGIASLYSLLDTDTDFEHIEIDNTNPFPGVSDCKYRIDLYNDTFYDPLDFIDNDGDRIYKLKRGNETGEEIVYSDIAIIVTATYKGQSITKKVLISAEKTKDDYMLLTVKKCL